MRRRGCYRQRGHMTDGQEGERGGMVPLAFFISQISCSCPYVGSGLYGGASCGLVDSEPVMGRLSDVVPGCAPDCDCPAEAPDAAGVASLLDGPDAADAPPFHGGVGAGGVPPFPDGPDVGAGLPLSLPCSTFPLVSVPSIISSTRFQMRSLKTAAARQVSRRT